MKIEGLPTIPEEEEPPDDPPDTLPEGVKIRDRGLEHKAPKSKKLDSHHNVLSTYYMRDTDRTRLSSDLYSPLIDCHILNSGRQKED